MSPPLELWQTEWCPASHRVRQRLTELGLDFVARQVPVEREQRDALERVSGQRAVPVLCEHGRTVAGEAAILEYLSEHHPEPAGAAAHAEKAARAKRKELEHACREFAAATH